MAKDNAIGLRLTIKQKQIALLSRKLKYILSFLNLKDITVARQFGYEEGGMVGKWSDDKNYSYKIPLMAQESLDKHFQIPLKIWETTFQYDEVAINKVIREYQEEEKQEKQVETFLETQYRSFFDEQISDERRKALLAKLEGKWYIYVHAERKGMTTGDIYIIEINILNNGTILYPNSNGVGYLNIRPHESYMEKITQLNQTTVLLRFSNENISYGIFPLAITASTIAEKKPMLHFGFCARKKYSEKEAITILSSYEKSLLKIDSSFHDRIINEHQYR